MKAQCSVHTYMCDDLIYTENDSAMFESFKKSMMAEFEMSNLGMMHYFLGIEVVQSTAGIFISQKKYVQEILDKVSNDELQFCEHAYRVWFEAN